MLSCGVWTDHPPPRKRKSRPRRAGLPARRRGPDTRIRAAFHLLKNAMNRYREKNQRRCSSGGDLRPDHRRGLPAATTDIGTDDEPVLLGSERRRPPGWKA